MNICIKDWNGTPHCMGTVVNRIHGSWNWDGGAEIAILVLLVGTIAYYVFRDPA